MTRPVAPMASALAAALLALLCVSTPVSADSTFTATATAQPDRAGAQSQIAVSASGSSGGLAQALPEGITIAMYRGFGADLSAVAKRCTSTATPPSCPADSQAAAGTFAGTATYPLARRSFTGTIQAFLAPASGGDLADVIVVVSAEGFTSSARGQLVAITDPTYGYELRFDPLPHPPVPAGVTVTIDKLSVTVAAKRKLTAAGRPAPRTGRRRHKRARCRAHRRRCRPRRVAHRRRRKPGVRRRVPPAKTVSLITNPTVCSGSWPLQLRVRYADRTDVRDTPIACTG